MRRQQPSHMNALSALLITSEVRKTKLNIFYENSFYWYTNILEYHCALYAPSCPNWAVHSL